MVFLEDEMKLYRESGKKNVSVFASMIPVPVATGMLDPKGVTISDDAIPMTLPLELGHTP